MSIDIEKLGKTQQIVVHANCPDGVASAIILHDALRLVPVRFVRHGAELDAVEQLPFTLFCDICPAGRIARDFMGINGMVLDHHKTAKDTVWCFEQLGSGVFADETEEPGVSGALLAFRHVWKPLVERQTAHLAEYIRETRAERASYFAMVAGIRDTWQTTSALWEMACAQAEALRFWPFENWPDQPFGVNDDMFSDMLSLGDILLKKKAERTAQAIKDGYRFITAKGVRVLIVSTIETSDVAETVSDVDLVVGFLFRSDGDRPIAQISARSKGAFDCAAFCKSLDGGGHARAAGAEVQIRDCALQPYAMVQYLVHLFETKP